jgi:hypothetical protein
MYCIYRRARKSNHMTNTIETVTPVVNCDGELVDININEIITFIFGQDPKPANTIKLVPTEDSLDNLKPHDIFVFVKTVALHGMQYLFGTSDFSSLSESDFAMMRQYTNSFGFDIDYRVIETEDYHEYSVSFKANTGDIGSSSLLPQRCSE